MGICNQLYDKPFEYGFMIDYKKKHWQYSFSQKEKKILEATSIDIQGIHLL
jgi:hypothetical protein